MVIQFNLSMSVKENYLFFPVQSFLCPCAQFACPNTAPDQYYFQDDFALKED